MTTDFYAGNRQRLLDKLEEGSVVFLYSGTAPVKSNDQNMSPFSVNRNFYYLTGIDTQNVWLVLSKTAAGAAATLFIDQPDEEIIKWNGKMLTRERACERSGVAVSDVKYMQDMDRAVARLLREKYPALAIKNAARLIAGLRAVKSPEEIQCLRRAGDVTIEALRSMLKSARPGEYEYQWAADYEHHVARAGLRHAFTTIAAAGPNAVMLHYVDNDCVAKDGDLILFDLGAEYQYYSADVSRTFPIGGRFTDRQKELYGIVLEAMAISRDKMRPGVPTKESNQAVIDFYKKALRAAKLIRDDSEVSRYYYHGVSHSLGLDTHDPSDRTVYEPGMVITCEPGLYVAEEGIGIRLENDILVTGGAPEDLIGNRLLDIAEIEEIMRK